MSPRQQRLIRDIAGLFIKYDLKDWEIVLNEIRQTRFNDQTDLSKSILEMSALAASAKKAKTSKPKILKSSTTKIKPLSKRLLALKAALGSREILPTQIDLRRFAVSVGLKESLPTQRSEAIDDIMLYLNTKSDARVRDLIQRAKGSLQSHADFHDEYARWAAIILKGEDR